MLLEVYFGRKAQTDLTACFLAGLLNSLRAVE
jgi:hypothetical protein